MKKIMTLLLTLTLTFTMFAINAYAEDALAVTSDAGINFTESTTAPEVIEAPTDPKDPDTELFKNISGRNIHFGTQEASATNQTYKSVENGEAEDTNKYIGAVLENSQASYKWTLKVAMGDFYVGESKNLENFKLTLSPQEGSAVSNAGAGTLPVASTIELKAGEAAKTILNPSAGNHVGRFGHNWSGELFVPVGSVKYVGNSQAVMTWSIVAEA